MTCLYLLHFCSLFLVCWFFQVGKCHKGPACRYSHGMWPLLFFTCLSIERIIRAILSPMQNYPRRPLATKVAPAPKVDLPPAPKVPPAPREGKVGGGGKLPGETTVSNNTNIVIVVMKLHFTGERGATYYFYQH